MLKGLSDSIGIKTYFKNYKLLLVILKHSPKFILECTELSRKKIKN
jgi:hypothetical protein